MTASCSQSAPCAYEQDAACDSPRPAPDTVSGWATLSAILRSPRGGLSLEGTFRHGGRFEHLTGGWAWFDMQVIVYMDNLMCLYPTIMLRLSAVTLLRRLTVRHHPHVRCSIEVVVGDDKDLHLT